MLLVFECDEILDEAVMCVYMLIICLQSMLIICLLLLAKTLQHVEVLMT